MLKIPAGRDFLSAHEYLTLIHNYVATKYGKRVQTANALQHKVANIRFRFEIDQITESPKVGAPKIIAFSVIIRDGPVKLREKKVFIGHIERADIVLEEMITLFEKYCKAHSEEKRAEAQWKMEVRSFMQKTLPSAKPRWAGSNAYEADIKGSELDASFSKYRDGTEKIYLTIRDLDRDKLGKIIKALRS